MAFSGSITIATDIIPFHEDDETLGKTNKSKITKKLLVLCFN